MNNIMSKKICITFAGVVGSSKTPIAIFLSGKLGLPVLNNDAIRIEILEDLREFQDQEYKKRRDDRLEAVLERNISFIYDASIDREWQKLHEWLLNYNYAWFIISLDLSKDLLVKLYKIKGYGESMERIDQLISDHDNFLLKHGQEINLHISDAEFDERLSLCYEKLKVRFEK